MNRYRVVPTPDRQRYVIFDRELFAYCTLPDDPESAHPNLLPLEWRSKAGAEAWLNQCYRLWESGKVPAPKNWKPTPSRFSPWLMEQIDPGSRSHPH